MTGWRTIAAIRASRRGVLRSVAELERDTRAFVDATNVEPRPFRWVKAADDILASVERFCLRSLDVAATHKALARTSGAGS